MIAVVAAFVVAVIASSQRAATPTGITPGDGGMAMAGDQMVGITLRDINGRSHPLPGGRPGAIVFIGDATSCECAPVVAAARRVAARLGQSARVIAVDLDGADSGGQVAGFLRSAGAAGMPAALDTRLGDLARYFNGPSSGEVFVYDRRGRVVADLESPSGKTLERALRKAGLR